MRIMGLGGGFRLQEVQLPSRSR